MLNLGGSVIGFSDANSSSASKGESVSDTIRVISCFADICAMRHPKEGAPMVAASRSSIPVINAGDGVEVLGKLVAEGVDSPVVMISGHADINTAVDCIKKGAFDFIEKPLDLNRVLITIKNATDKVALTSQNNILKKKAT